MSSCPDQIASFASPRGRASGATGSRRRGGRSKAAPIDYLMLDYLAEVTMSHSAEAEGARSEHGLRARLRRRDGERAAGGRRARRAGHRERRRRESARLRRRGARGGARSAASTGELRIGVVTGDDLLPRLDELIAQGHALANMETGEPLSTVRDRVLSANAYIGSAPIVEALARGANVVITGRSTDTALTMAPLRHEFGWARDDWDRLAAGIVAGHIIECGAQCSGGNCLYDWRNIPDLANVGYPIVEAQRRRHVRRHQASEHRRAHLRAVGHRAARLRDGRSALVHHARRRRRLHDDPARARRARIACACSASRAARRPTSSRCRSRIAPASRRSARSSTRGPTRSRRRSSPIACCASGSTASASRSISILTEFVGVIATHGPLAGAAATIRRRCSCASACAARTRQGGRALHARDRAARAQRPAERHRLRRRPAEGRGDRRLLARARRQDASCRRTWRCSHEGPPRSTSRTRARATRATRPTSASSRSSRSGIRVLDEYAHARARARALRAASSPATSSDSSCRI